ncbi:Fungal specific transcription factor domain-containing protein [Cladophialophora immunda]|nr:Fungal specific transcription factor domain-containing protein [Cladophialophora immunda]
MLRKSTMEDNANTSVPAAPRAPVNQPRRGGRVACSFCHTRRIRCNAFQSQPCSNCISAQMQCQLIESKRGRYVRPRTKKGLSSDSSAQSQTNPPLTMSLLTKASSPRTILSPTYDFSKQVDGRPLRIERLDFVPGPFTAQLRNNHKLTHKEGSENLYARLSELALSPPQPRNLHGIQTIYLGESWLLTYVVQKVINGETESDSSSPATLQVPLPPSVGDKPENLGYETRLDPEEIEILNIRGAFTLPDKEVSDRLIQTFFECVYPAFPIFDREEFAQLYESGQQSLLILNAIYAISSTLCEDDIITKAGFDSRNAARKVFLKRAKALHDADHETNKICLVQAVFLLSFLWNGSTDEKDMAYWLSIAIGNAQGKGMHRSTTNSTLRPRDRRLWKRIWWSLYVRDRHCSVNIGRPMRIRDDDYDVEPLEESDFEDDSAQSAFVSTIYGQTSRIHALYAIAMSKLSMIFGDINLTKFPICKARPTLGCEEISSQLKKWRQQLPSELQLGDEEEGSFWAKMLELTYNQHLIVLHRPENSKVLDDKKVIQSTAFMAAKKITSLCEDFLALGLLRKSQLQICPSLFSALSMYVLMVQHSDQIQRKLAEHKSRLLLLACGEIAKTWPACGWILRLFETIFRNLGEKNSGQGPVDQAVQGPSRQWPQSTHADGTENPPETSLEELQRNTVSSESYQDPVSLGTASGRDGSTAHTMPELPPQFLNIPDLFDTDLLSGLSQDFGFGHNFYPDLMEG